MEENKARKMISGTYVTETTDQADNEDELMDILLALETVNENNDESYV